MTTNIGKIMHICLTIYVFITLKPVIFVVMNLILLALIFQMKTRWSYSNS